MFRKEMYKIEDVNILRIVDSSGLFMDIIPELGAMVYQVGLLNSKGVISNILESDSAEDLKNNPWFRGRILFPFNDRIPRGKYSFKGKEYQLPINDFEDNSSIHGLVYNNPFSVKDIRLTANSGEIDVSNRIEEGDFSSYPFSILLDITYKISSIGFSVSYSFKNLGSHLLPVALGWHPYFSFKEKVNSLKLQAGGGEYIAVDETLNPTGDVLPVRGGAFDFTKAVLIGKTELDIAFTASSDGFVYLQNERDTLEIYLDTELFPYVQLFIPPDRNSIAIEPITAGTNAFNIKGLGKIELSPGEERSGSVKISLNGVG